MSQPPILRMTIQFVDIRQARTSRYKALTPPDLKAAPFSSAETTAAMKGAVPVQLAYFQSKHNIVFRTRQRLIQAMSQEAKDVIQEEEAAVESETATVDEDTAAMPPPSEKAIEIEKMEEQKLKSKFPGEIH